VTVGGIEGFLRELGLIMAEYQHAGRNYDSGRDRSIAYGNVRYRKWENSGRITVGIIYETPGGSTNQINIEFEPTTGQYSLPHATRDGDFASLEEADVLSMVRAHAEQIPEKRRERLHAFADCWIEEGRTRAALFDWLNQLLYQDLKGGRITHGELAEACRYVVERTAPEGEGDQPG
jgi:hypothetical protein